MAHARLSDTDFVALYEDLGPPALARKVGMDVRNVRRRRERIEKRLQRQVTGPRDTTRRGIEHSQRVSLTVKNGVVIAASDGHYWPGKPSTVHRALVKFTEMLKPKAFVYNGDAFDGAKISRHPPIGWEARPDVIDELNACRERMAEIEAAAGSAKLVWTLGNHDARFETRLATVAPEYARVHGFHLKDHFPAWSPAWSAFVNDDVVIKHRFKGGMHAPQNNALWSGKTTVTGHLHSAKVQPITDYNGTRFGVDSGCVADPEGGQFVDYTEDNPLNWRSAFTVLTFKAGKLLWPELVVRWDKDHVQFRGEVIRV